MFNLACIIIYSDVNAKLVLHFNKIRLQAGFETSTLSVQNKSFLALYPLHHRCVAFVVNQFYALCNSFYYICIERNKHNNTLLAQTIKNHISSASCAFCRS